MPLGACLRGIPSDSSFVHGSMSQGTVHNELASAPCPAQLRMRSLRFMSIECRGDQRRKYLYPTVFSSPHQGLTVRVHACLFGTTHTGPAWSLTDRCCSGPPVTADQQPGLPRVAVLQNAYSLTCRTFDTALAECCHQEGVALLAYSPLAMGLLTVWHMSAQGYSLLGKITTVLGGADKVPACAI
jgi:hypothetical protein